MKELVWVVEDGILDLLGGLAGDENSDFDGFYARDGQIRTFWNSLSSAKFVDRRFAETDTSHKQVIPYAIITSEGRYLTYERSGGNEARLDKKYSIGVGGHINPEDQFSDWRRVVYFSVLRELDEELYALERGCRFPVSNLVYDKLKIKGILYDDSDEVGQVHIGMILHAELEPEFVPTIQMLSEGKGLTWKAPWEIYELGDRLEGWSRKSLKALEAGAQGCPVSLKELSER